jgi:regulator of RNase E activity RraA
VEAAGPGTIIVVAHEGREDVAGWGGLLSLAATIREVEGVVVDGACRDIDESRELDLPVFARSAVPVTARSRIEETGWNIPVKLSGIPVSPGDLILADGSGIVAIPSELAEAVIGIAETIVQKERRMIADVRSGKRISDVMGTDYETMLRKESI